MLIQLEVPEMSGTVLESFMQFCSRYGQACAEDGAEIKGLTREELTQIDAQHSLQKRESK